MWVRKMDVLGVLAWVRAVRRYGEAETATADDQSARARVTARPDPAYCLVLDVIDRGARDRPMMAARLFGAEVLDCRGRDVRVAVGSWNPC
jgi:hypothetical protein